MTDLLTLLVSLLTTAPDFKPVDLGQRFWLDASLRLGTLIEDDGGDSDIFFVTHHVEGAIPIGRGNLVLAWDLTGLITDEEDSWGLGNPFIGFTAPITKEVRFTGGVVLPFLDNDDEDNEDGRVILAGLLNNNLREPWTWFPDALTVLVGADIAAPLGRYVTLEGDLRLAATLPTDDEANDELVLIADAELGLLVSIVHLSVGLVVFDDENVIGDDQLHVTASFGVRAPLGRGRFYADVTIGLGETEILDDSDVPTLLIGFATPF